MKINEASYSFDAEAFEAVITPNTKIFIHCNPHNSTGNVWSEADLRQIGEICIRHNILVVSDEIDEDLIFNPRVKHIPFASLGEEFAKNSVVCTAPSKTFNISGLQCSNLFIPNSGIRAEFRRTLLRGELHFINNLGAVACETAYRHGEGWLEELLTYVCGNHQYFASSVHQLFPKLRVLETDALYLAWLDCRELGQPVEELEKFMLADARVWFDRGTRFGPQRRGFMRVNLGCSRSIVDEALGRMRAVLM